MIPMTGSLDGASLLEDRQTFDALLQRTIGRWELSPLWALRGKMFTFAEKALIIALLDLWHTGGRQPWFYASHADLASLMGGSMPTFLRALRSLDKKKILKVKRGNRYHATSYHVDQNFLFSLVENPTPLKTSNYSCVKNLKFGGGEENNRL